MNEKRLEKLHTLEVEIRRLREKLEKLEERRATLQKMEVAEALEDLELTELHLDRLKANLSETWADLTAWVQEALRKEP